MPRTPDPEVGDSIPIRVKSCCVFELGTFTPQKVLVKPRKRWLRPNMTDKLFTGTLRINQPTNSPLQLVVCKTLASIIYTVRAAVCSTSERPGTVRQSPTFCNKKRIHQDNMSVCFIPLTPHFYKVKLGFTGVFIFLIFALKHRLWVLVRTASPMRF